jgi:hypothetical protein
VGYAFISQDSLLFSLCIQVKNYDIVIVEVMQPNFMLWNTNEGHTSWNLGVIKELAELLKLNGFFL